jgi:mRNA interferase RelE/StbE
MGEVYSVVFVRSARKELEALPRRLALRILRRVEALAHEPRPAGCVKLSGSSHLWRVRVGDYRVIYSIDDDRRLVDVRAVRHRREAYQ